MNHAICVVTINIFIFATIMIVYMCVSIIFIVMWNSYMSCISFSFHTLVLLIITTIKVICSTADDNNSEPTNIC